MSKWKWWHGAALLAAVGATQVALARALPNSRDVEFYRRQRRPSFAPPASAFPIAWGINALSLTAGFVRVLNLSPSNARTDYLRAQSAAWVLFSTFNAAYFGLRSPLNAAVVTLLYDIATIRSFGAAMRTRDRGAIASLVTTLAWLSLATPLSIAQAVMNRDDFWGTGPLTP